MTDRPRVTSDARIAREMVEITLDYCKAIAQAAADGWKQLQDEAENPVRKELCKTGYETAISIRNEIATFAHLANANFDNAMNPK